MRNCWMHPFIVPAALLLLALVARPAAADAVQLAKVDPAGLPTGEAISGDLQEVNGTDGVLIVRHDGVAVRVDFISVDFDDLHKAVYRWLKRQDDPENDADRARLAAIHVAIARLALINFAPDDADDPNLSRARDGMDEAVKLVPALAEELEHDRVLWRESRAMQLLAEARAELEAGKFDAAERQLKRIGDDYADAAVAREGVAMAGEVSRQRSARAAAETAAEEAATDRPDPLARVYPLVDQVEEKLREGHQHWSVARNSRILNPWKQALNDLDRAEAVFRETVRRMPSEFRNETQEMRLENRIQQLKLMLYKGLGHYYLGSTAFTECEALLNKALAFAPTDRELLQLRFVLNMHFLRRTVRPDDPDGPKPPDLDLGGDDDDDG